ncbi:putative MFS family arabinose efflux permease [Frondihabitans sp. PhB188]|uniref:MFS transporter n=1 Tax=Frondihabitans sp. PhB188 TaxID=2485200 RepID=UPI000F48CD38|nr:MFS transporter [Frondihabitans sp. PhB188]ROQ38667.1 putative MFS family arabinose efflux permease [Frondihabitans sp. PhB188]
MSHHSPAGPHEKAPSPFKQPRAVWAVAFACVVSFMGIGLVDPILKTLAGQLSATPSQVELLFTSYLVVTAVCMLGTGWISSRIGAKRTLIGGLSIIVVFAALAGASGSIGEIVGFRAGWGLGNALFIATSLSVIVGSASGGFAGAIVLYESALGVGIALGPLIGGVLGSISWRGPFFGVSALMFIALLATVFLLPPLPRPARKQKLSEPLTALKHKALRTTSIVGFLYNWAFFTLLGYSPFLMGIDSPIKLGFVFCGWGILVAVFAVWGAPWLQRRFGTPKTLYVNFVLMAVDLAVIGIVPSNHVAVIVCVIIAGAFIGVNNTLVTTAVMSISPVERPVASATYGFVRFIGGGMAPFVAGILAAAFSEHVPFLLGTATLVAAAIVLSTAHKALTAADRGEEALPATAEEEHLAEAEAVGNAD